MEGSWKLRRKYRETPINNPKIHTPMRNAMNSLIIVIITSTARLAGAAARHGSAAQRRRGTETAAPRPVSCTRACGGDQQRAWGGSRGRVGRVTPSN
eukprot:4639662-Prymnesium_polylepis.1